jgi:hypothetical protein
MRFAAVVLAIFMAVAGVWAKDKPAQRYDIDADLEVYPQDTPQKTLESVIKAIADKKIDYLLAQLADPKFVDARVKMHGSFEEFVKEASDHLARDPSVVKQLKRFLKDGNWNVNEPGASAKLKDDKEKGVFLRKVGDRWFLENRTTDKEKS